MSDRYTIERDGVAYHVLDGERALATCVSGTGEENRRDAERIKSLLNQEVGYDPAGPKPCPACGEPAYCREDSGLCNYECGDSRCNLSGPRRRLDREALDVWNQLVLSEAAGADLTTYLAYEAGQRDAPGWRPVTESEPKDHRAVYVPDFREHPADEFFPAKVLRALRQDGRWYYFDGDLWLAKPWPSTNSPTLYIVIPPLPSEEPDKSLAYLEFEERLAQTGEGEMSFEEARAELVGIAASDDTTPPSAADDEQVAGYCRSCMGPIYHRPGKPGEFDHECEHRCTADDIEPDSESEGYRCSKCGKPAVYLPGIYNGESGPTDAAIRQGIADSGIGDFTIIDVEEETGLLTIKRGDGQLYQLFVTLEADDGE